MKKLIITLGIIGMSIIGFAATNSNQESQPPLLPDGSMPPKMADGKQPPMPPDAQGQPGMMPPPNNSGKQVDTSKFTATHIVTKKTDSLSNKKLESSVADKSVVLAKDSSTLNIKGGTFTKTGDTSNDDGSNFYGQNAAVLAMSGSTINITGTVINTNSEGSNSIFATGDNSIINVENVTIHNKKNSSRGLDATYNGTVNAKNVTITTEGAHSASLATDRGEGTINVDGAKLNTSGQGSPVIYSTGNITLKNGTGISTGSEMGVVEGKNSIIITNSDLTNYGNNGFMLYQSFSGDAESGVARLNVSDSKLTNHSSGAFIYVNNTVAEVTLSNNTIVNDKSDILIKAASDSRWGVDGKNGGHLTFSATNENLFGNVVVDKNSTVALNLGKSVNFTGAINSDNQGKNVSVKLEKNAQWTLTGDTYVTSLINEDTSNKNINTNGYKLHIAK